MSGETVRTEDPISLLPFASLDLDDPFFDSLRRSYDFDEWVGRKALAGESTWVATDKQTGGYVAMLYLKREYDTDRSVVPALTKPRLKIGTFKVDFRHHTSLGKRLLAIALRDFAGSGLSYAYVTMFRNTNTEGLRSLLTQYGFRQIGEKGCEEVWAKRRPSAQESNPFKAFPFLTSFPCGYHILAIRPEYHSRMFGDLRLATEKDVPVEDEIRTNTVEKIYLSGASGAALLKKGDRIAIYRTAPKGTVAKYSSVISSICTVTDRMDIRDFPSREEFFKFVKGRSVFTQAELEDFWRTKKYPSIISMLYNFPLRKRPIRQKLLDAGIITPEERLVCKRIDQQSFQKILDIGEADESFIVH
ncbi:MAG: hypothetical protein AYW82_03680 [Bifidobacterium dentium]|nr:MAG: hypothetical protein AYW82_03680 [Bifidobacterium dentium]